MFLSPRRHYLLGSTSEQDDLQRALWVQEALDGGFESWWVFESIGRTADRSARYSSFYDKGVSRCVETNRGALSDHDAELAWTLLFSETQDERLTSARRSIGGLTIKNSKWEFERLSQFPELQVLYLRDLPYETLNLKAHDRLTRLTIDGCGELRSLQGLDSLPQLQSLTIDNCAQLSSLDGLRAPSLTTLIIQNCPSLADVRGLQGAPQLQACSLLGAQELKDVSALQSHLELRALLLHGTSVEKKGMPAELKRVSTWAKKTNLEKLAQRLPLKAYVQSEADAAKPQKGKAKSLAKLKRLLCAKDIDQVRQGLELLDQVGAPDWCDALLNDAYLHEETNHRMRELHGEFRLRSKRFQGPHESYVILALLRRAAPDSVIANDIRAKVKTLDLYEAREKLHLDAQDLETLPNLERLRMRRVKVSAGAVPQLKALEKVEGRTVESADLRWLSRAPRLKLVELRGSRIASSEGLVSEALEHVALLGQVDPRGLLKQVRGLQSLYLSCGGATLSEPIELPLLKYLQLEDATIQGDACFKPLKALTMLSLLQARLHADVSFEGLESLNRLHCDGLSNAQGAPLDTALKFPKLSLLVAKNMRLDSWAFFSTLRGLRSLMLDGIELHCPPKPSLDSGVAERVELDRCKLATWEQLDAWGELHELSLKGCRALAGGPVTGTLSLRELRTLTVENMRLASLRDFGGCTKLESLKLERVDTKAGELDLQPLESMDSLRALSLSGCPRVDAKPLRAKKVRISQYRVRR